MHNTQHHDNDTDNFEIRNYCDILQIEINSNIDNILKMSASNLAALYTGNFLTTNIEFSQHNHASVFFAHLQNVLNELSAAQKLHDSVHFNKIDKVLYDIYLQHKKLEANYETVEKGIKQLMNEFHSMIQQCKTDKEQLSKSMQQRQTLMEKLKEVNQQLYNSCVENQMLRETVAQLKQLNSLMIEKNDVLEEQAQNNKVQVLGMEDYKRISGEYDRLLESNQDIRKDLIEITEQTQLLHQITTPFKICCWAVRQNPELKDKLWEIAEQGNQQLKEGLQETKKQFYKFNFEAFLNKSQQTIK